MKFKIQQQTANKNELVGRKAKAIFTMLNMGVETKETGWWLHEEKEGIIIYSDDKKATILSNSGVPMCFTLDEVVLL